MQKSSKKTILEEANSWIESNQKVVLARVIQTWGSSPCPIGSKMIVNEKGDFLGSVSGGCVEGAVVTEALQIIESGERKTISFGYSDDEAFSVGLTCGGTVNLYIEPFDW